ncbi:MAG TPA: spirocyclase AveC family protein, partial [Acidimicrobiia bacterium]|nr:spirocyclase AveC family protein [Acidimicrobiia bacterium]
NPLENYTQVMRVTNGYLFNLGTWIGHVPGVVSPTAGRVPEPLVYMLALYFGYGALVTFAVSAGMTRAVRRWPARRGVRLFLATWAVLFAVEVVVETLWARTGIMVYAGGIHRLSLFGGTRAQLPLHIPVLVSLTLTLFAWLHHSPAARAALFRGAECSAHPAALRILAMVGAANVIMLAYALPAQFFALHDGRFPALPSYLNNGVCGPAPQPPCPGPGTPILRRR